MKKHLLASAIALCASTPALADLLKPDTTENWTLTPSLEVLGGIYMNDHLREGTAGREHQIKMTRAILGLDAKKDTWRARVELVGLGDEMYQESGDNAYRDIYRNLGTDLYYYGDHPVREAWVGQKFDLGFWRAGRVINLMGVKPGGHFETAPEAPHAVILKTGLYNGVQAGINLANDSVHLAVGIMGGNDKPRLGANNYLNGKLDVNEKGNNSPVIEVYGAFRPTETIRLYAGMLSGKEGSAPGSFNSGKHNDDRVTFGAEWDLYKSEWIGVNLLGESNTFTTGLTEEGVQGRETPTESYDIDQNGWFASIALYFPKAGTTLRVTHEEMDRMDALAWQEIAAYDKDHPVNNAAEDRQIVSIEKHFDGGVDLKAFYRQDNVPFLTGGDQQLEDRAGMTLSYNAVFDSYSAFSSRY